MQPDNGEQPNSGDAFVTKLHSSGAALICSFYLGGSDSDSGLDIDVDAAGNIYVTGLTGSTNFPTAGAFDTSCDDGISCGHGEAFVTKIKIEEADLAITKNAPSNVAAGSDITYTITVTNNGPDAAAAMALTDVILAHVSADGGHTFNDLPGETNSTLTFTAQAAQHNNQYRAKFTNLCGVKPSNAAMLTVSAQCARVFYLHGTGPNTNPPVLFLDLNPPAAPNPKFRDSPPLSYPGGNPWKEIGIWPAAPALTSGTLTELGQLRVWLGLKNSDDQGTRFDLRAEIYKNGVLVASGETYCIQGVTRNPNLAKEVSVAFVPFSPTVFNGATDALALQGLDPDRD